VIEVTEWARDILTRSHHAASRFNPGTTIRLARAGHEVQAQLAEAPEADDQPIVLGEVTVYVEAGLDGLVDVEEPHDRLVLRPAGSTPNIRGEH
jgi:sporulation-control protein spo0M